MLRVVAATPSWHPRVSSPYTSLVAPKTFTISCNAEVRGVMQRGFARKNAVSLPHMRYMLVGVESLIA